VRGLGMAEADVAALVAAMKECGPYETVSAAATSALALADVQTGCYPLAIGRFVEQLRSHGCVLSDSAVALLLLAYHTAESNDATLFNQMSRMNERVNFSNPQELAEWLLHLRLYGLTYSMGDSGVAHGMLGLSWEDVKQIATFFASLNQYHTALKLALKGLPARHDVEVDVNTTQREDEFTPEFAIVGLQGAGKTALMNAIGTHWTEGTVDFDSLSPTVGFNMRKVSYNYGKRKHTMKLWDLGGQPRFRGMWERYCRGVTGIM
jgi:hypothetical protein